jgi:acyl-CoA synthetase (NDP forming)
LGLPIYGSLEDLPEPAELALIAVAPGAIPGVIEDCARHQVRAAIITTSGFAEGGEEGRRLQEGLVATARRGGVRLIGPNTQGTINLELGLPVLSTPLPAQFSRPGPVSFVVQSALFPWEFLLHHPHVGLSKMIDLGNMCDVDHADCMEYLAEDSSTRVIALHIEGVVHGGRLMEACRRATSRKPVIALKAGRTASGMRAVASHTGSLAGRDEVYDAAFHQTGVFRAYDVDDLCDYILALGCLAPVRGRRVGILTTTGAGGAMAADACHHWGLEVAPLTSITLDRIREALPGLVSIHNPVDAWQMLDIPRLLPGYAAALNALSADPGVDSLVLITHLVPDSPFDTLDVMREFCAGGVPKPTSVWAVGSPERLWELSRLSTQGLISFPTVARAVRALGVSYAYHRRC